VQIKKKARSINGNVPMNYVEVALIIYAKIIAGLLAMPRHVVRQLLHGIR
jgi:hypothetical protein